MRSADLFGHQGSNGSQRDRVLEKVGFKAHIKNKKKDNCGEG